MIKMLAMDVDGTMTDGSIIISSDGTEIKSFSVKDGYGIVKARKSGVIPVIITGRESEIVSQRAAELGINEVHQGVQDKKYTLAEVASKYGISHSEIAYIGDDVNDLDAMSIAGMTFAPADAVDEIKNAVKIRLSNCGGHGAVRECIEYLFKSKLIEGE